MPWPVEVTNDFEAWYAALGEVDREAVNAAVDALEVRGPGLGRPLVGEIAGSRHGISRSCAFGPFASCSASTPAGRPSC